MPIRECYDCNGTGKDDASWDGRCPFCAGAGEVWESGEWESGEWEVEAVDDIEDGL